MIALKLNLNENYTYLRWSFVVFLSFCIAHFIIYQKLPYLSADYSFPLRSFIIVLIFGLIICESNTFVYRRLNRIIPLKDHMVKRIAVQFLQTWGATIAVYIILFGLINMLIMGGSFSLYYFTLYLGICLFVSTFECSLYTIKEMYLVLQKDRSKTARAIEDGQASLTFKNNDKLLKLSYKNIAYLHSRDGIVSLRDQEGKKYITLFSSINKIEDQFPDGLFFRVNRQFLINKQVIKSIEKKHNRQLKVHLRKGYADKTEDITVSRYRSSALKEWFRENN